MLLNSDVGKQDVVVTLARGIVNTQYQDLLREEGLVEGIKKSVLDTLGVTTAASTLAPGGKEIVELFTEAGGKGECTVLGFGCKLPFYAAAFANGALAHCLDYDDIHDVAELHPSIGAIPAAMAMAERIGRVSGKEFITAVTLGGDLMCRLGLALSPRWQSHVRDWLTTAVLGIFSSAATAGKLLKLDEEQMVDAFGIAFLQAGGTSELIAPGSIIRGFYAYNSAVAGVMGALMAQKGISGMKNSLEGRYGLFNMYFGGEYDRTPLVTDIGRRFEYPRNVGLKPWSSCRQSQTYIEATLDIVCEHDIKPTEIQVIKVFVGEQARRLCEPLETRQRPRTTMDARFSIPWCVACACARKKVGLTDFTTDGIKDPLTIELAKKVVTEFDPELDVRVGIPPGKVEIKTVGGRTYMSRVDKGLGNPEKPLTMDQAVQKFRECVSYSARPLPKGNVDKIIEMISNLEELDNVGEVIGLFAP